MAKTVCMGATMTCTFGVSPASLVVERPNRTAGVNPLANVMDFEPITNIPPFGMCNSPSNPATMASGVFTPAPCVPVITGPWAPGVPGVMVDDAPAVDARCQLTCQWGGLIQIGAPGQSVAEYP